MRVIGLSGGIASGKSTISNIFKEMGVPVIDCDDITHDILRIESPVIHKLVEAFGTEILNDDGTLSRKKLGSLVFNDKISLDKLNNIIHPAIKIEIIKSINLYRESNQQLCVVDGALLREGIFMDIVDILILVFVNRDIQIKRLMERNLVSKEEALNRISSQISFEEKKKYADYIIDNSYDVEYTRSQLNNIMYEILKVEDGND